MSLLARFLPSAFPPALGSVFLPSFSHSFPSLQRGAEHWIDSQPACPRCGLYGGMQASEREGGREREREREGERGRCVAASLQHLSPDSHSQSTHSTAISSSTNTGLTASVTALKGPVHLKISQHTEPEWRRREHVIQLHSFTVRKTEDLPWGFIQEAGYIRRATLWLTMF